MADRRSALPVDRILRKGELADGVPERRANSRLVPDYRKEAGETGLPYRDSAPFETTPIVSSRLANVRCSPVATATLTSDVMQAS